MKLVSVINQFLGNQSKPVIVGLSLLSVIFLGIADYWCGFELSFALFYILPISLAAWFAGLNCGGIVSIASAITWQIANQLAGQIHSSPIIIYWNAGIRFGFFIVVSLILSKLHQVLEKEKSLSRIDFLTGAMSSREFYDTLERELFRAHRHNHPITISYIDLDNFKSINDTFGHSAGDEVLKIIVTVMLTNLRKIDAVARLGGDEFAVLFPGTDHEAARKINLKLQQTLLNEMADRQYPVTFSIGSLTCLEPPRSTDELIKMADNLMYTVKNNGKNAINYSVYPPSG